MQRVAAVAGQFYPGRTEALREMVSGFFQGAKGEVQAVGIVSPHAGYIYSGAIAGETFARVRVPGTVVLLGPNHHGIGSPAALFPEGSWLTPLGESAVDGELSKSVLKECPMIQSDPAPHRHEHSLEVQVPFIQLSAPGASIVPICLGSLGLAELVELGEGIARAIAPRKRDVLMVASTDMTHYEAGEAARAKDKQALDRILSLDPEGLWETVRGGRISMCGVAPTVAMLAAARRLGASSAALVRYGNSGDVTGDQSQVVGYAGVILS